jgi:hypothetical protein
LYVDQGSLYLPNKFGLIVNEFPFEQLNFFPKKPELSEFSLQVFACAVVGAANIGSKIPTTAAIKRRFLIDRPYLRSAVLTTTIAECPFPVRSAT